MGCLYMIKRCYFFFLLMGLMLVTVGCTTSEEQPPKDEVELEITEELFFNNRVLDKMFPYVSGEHQVCWDALGKVLGKSAEEISMDEYAAIAIILLRLESDHDITQFIRYLATDEGFVRDWDPTHLTFAPDHVSEEDVMWSFCPNKIANIQQFLYFIGDVNLEAIMYGGLSNEDIRELEVANRQILKRIGLLSAAVSLTPTLTGDSYYGTPLNVTFKRQVILGCVNGPFLNFVGQKDRGFEQLADIRVLMKFSKDLNMSGYTVRRISHLESRLQITLEEACGGRALSRMLGYMEDRILDGYPRDRIVARMWHDLLLAEFGRFSDFEMDFVVYGRSSIQAMPTANTLRMIDEFNRVIEEMKNDPARREWINDALDYVYHNINSDFSLPICLSDITDGNIEAVSGIYFGVNIYDEQGRLVTVAGISREGREQVQGVKVWIPRDRERQNNQEEDSEKEE